MRTPFGTIRAILDLSDDLSRIWHYWGYFDYEPGVTRLLYKLLQDKTCVFDVGANIGYYTLLMAQAGVRFTRLSRLPLFPLRWNATRLSTTSEIS